MLHAKRNPGCLHHFLTSCTCVALLPGAVQALRCAWAVHGLDIATHNSVCDWEDGKHPVRRLQTPVKKVGKMNSGNKEGWNCLLVAYLQ